MLSSGELSCAGITTVDQRPLDITRLLNIIKEQPLRLKRLMVDCPRKYDEFHETPLAVSSTSWNHTLSSRLAYRSSKKVLTPV